MREILFRGKIEGHGDWVKGYYAQFDILSPSSGKTYKKTAILTEDGPIDVIPETVGQFTGLLDQNGNKIFEGDILTYPPDMEYYGEQYKYVVKYDNSCLVGNSNFWCMLSDGFGESEVIGNIHDNPELLEVE